MKKFMLFLGALLLTSVVYSQSNKEEIDLMQAQFGMDKKEAVAEFVKPSAAQKDAFWKIYDQYETERKDLGKERISLLQQYAKHYTDMTNAQADDWTRKVIDLQKRTDALLSNYYGKVKTATSPIVATQFYQIETYILTSIRMELLQSIPFVQKKQ